MVSNTTVLQLKAGGSSTKWVGTKGLRGRGKHAGSARVGGGGRGWSLFLRPAYYAMPVGACSAPCGRSPPLRSEASSCRLQAELLLRLLARIFSIYVEPSVASPLTLHMIRPLVSVRLLMTLKRKTKNEIEFVFDIQAQGAAECGILGDICLFFLCFSRRCSKAWVKIVLQRT